MGTLSQNHDCQVLENYRAEYLTVFDCFVLFLFLSLYMIFISEEIYAVQPETGCRQ